MKLFLLIIIFILSFMFFNFKSNFNSVPTVYPNLITPVEADYILSKNDFNTSITVGGLDESIRKSQTMWISKNDPVIHQLYKRLSKQFNFPIENAEDLQVVKYNANGYYREHHDACCEKNEECKDFVKRGGQRVLTILIYLNDDFEEGATKFPKLNLELKAPVYGGVVFYPLKNNTCDPEALHTGTPVKSGTKYVCNIWVRESEFR